jgi:hypothetical protein
METLAALEREINRIIHASWRQAGGFEVNGHAGNTALKPLP